MTDILPSYVLAVVDAAGCRRTRDHRARRLHRRGRRAASARPASISPRCSTTPARSGQRSLGALTFHQRAMLLKQFALALTERKQELYDLSKRAGATTPGLPQRHRRRHRRAVHLLVEGPARAAERPGLPRRRRSSRCRRTARSSVATSSRGCPVSRCRSTPSTSRCGARSRSSRPRSLPECPASSSPRRRPRTSPRPGCGSSSSPACCPRVAAARQRLRARASSTTCGSAISSASPAAPRRPTACAHTRACRPAACASPTRPTRSTPRCSAPTPCRAPPSSTPIVKQLVIEMTTKAGQKCTAIRRAIVPAGAEHALVDAVRAKIAESVVIGDPRAERSRWARSCRWSSATRCCAASRPWKRREGASCSARPSLPRSSTQTARSAWRRTARSSSPS